MFGRAWRNGSLLEILAIWSAVILPLPSLYHSCLFLRFKLHVRYGRWVESKMELPNTVALSIAHPCGGPPRRACVYSDFRAFSRLVPPTHCFALLEPAAGAVDNKTQNGKLYHLWYLRFIGHLCHCNRVWYDMPDPLPTPSNVQAAVHGLSADTCIGTLPNWTLCIK